MEQQLPLERKKEREKAGRVSSGWTTRNSGHLKERERERDREKSGAVVAAGGYTPMTVLIESGIVESATEGGGGGRGWGGGRADGGGGG